MLQGLTGVTIITDGGEKRGKKECMGWFSWARWGGAQVTPTCILVTAPQPLVSHSAQERTRCPGSLGLGEELADGHSEPQRTSSHPCPACNASSNLTSPLSTQQALRLCEQWHIIFSCNIFLSSCTYNPLLFPKAL